MADKQKALETAISQIEKNFGKGSIMRLGQNTAMNVEAISTGSVTLDAATGIGGLPRGRIIEIYGPESSGKTTLALHVVAEAQRMGGEAAFIDAEHALDPIYAANLGVDVDSLLVSQPDNGEQALEITEAPFGRYRCYSRRLRCGSCSAFGDRGRYGRLPCRSPRAPYVAGSQKARGRDFKVEYYYNFHKPAA